MHRLHFIDQRGTMRSVVVLVCCQMFLLSYASNETSKSQLGLAASQFNVVDSTANLRDETVQVSYFPYSSKLDNNSINKTSTSSVTRMSKVKNGRIKFRNENRQKALKNHSSKRGLKLRTLKSKNEGDEMTKHFIRNSSVVCNDGSTPGYYLKKSFESNRWIIFLEGGWLCSDGMSCLKRWFQSPQFMTSQNLPHVMKGVGILSSNRQENSFFFNGNHVFVPYCSSDSWSGSFKATDRDAFSFMGSNIVEEVVRDLVEVHRMGEVQSNDSLNSESTLVYLAGSSAGGTGVLLNIDRVSLLINQLHNSESERSEKHLIVRGISDSGWFIDNTQFRQTLCTGLQQCSPLETIKKAMPLWNAIVPTKCYDQYASDPWKCFFGQYVYPTLSTEVFVVQNLYDGAQLVANNVGSPVDSEQWNFIKDVGMETRDTLSHVRSLFAPGCLLHVLLTRSDWSTIKIRNINLPSQLQCWEKQELNKLKNKLGSETKSKLKKSNSVQSNIKFASPLNNSRYKNMELKDRRAKRRRRLSEAAKKHKNKEPNKRPQCEKMKANVYRQIDSCRWPHCNLSCPKLRDPYNGKEIDLIGILAQFDLDLNTVADALGVKLASLRSMDQRELMKLLVTSGNKR